MTAGQTQGCPTVSARRALYIGRHCLLIYCLCLFLCVFVFLAIYMLADANLEHFPSKECFAQVSSDQLVVAGSEEDDEGEEAARRPEDEDGDDRNARQRKLNYSTKVFEGVPIIVKGDFLICQQRKLTLHCVDGRRVLIVLRHYLQLFTKLTMY